jgi:hypothetical protein
MKLLSTLLLLTATVSFAAEAPLKVLLITGGCCHDYKAQKDILKKGLEARINCTVDQVHTDDHSTKPPLAILGNPDYAKGYDIVIHDECAADIKDPKIVEGVLKPHRDGIPGVNLHCAMHCYRVGNPGTPQKAGTPESMWFDYLGIQSSGHGPQEPIAITFLDKNFPITKDMADWTTMKEELYNNIQIFPTATPLAKGKQIVKNKKKAADGSETVEEKTVETVVAWINTYGKTRVFSTTIGHNNATVSDDKYLDLIARGVLWATDKIDANGKAKAGWGK